MSFKSILIAAVAAAALASGSSPVMAGDAPAPTYADVGGQQVRIATTMTLMEQGDRDIMNRAARRFQREIRRTNVPLDYPTLDAIPDARYLGYGDCKSFSVAFRNFMKARLRYHPDSLLLAVVDLPTGEPHMVLLIRVKDVIGGHREKTMVYDPNRPVILPIEKLIHDGYRFRARESAPGGILVNFNGRELS